MWEYPMMKSCSKMTNFMGMAKISGIKKYIPQDSVNIEEYVQNLEKFLRR